MMITELDRVYIPQDELLEFGYPENDIGRKVMNDNFISLIKASDFKSP